MAQSIGGEILAENRQDKVYGNKQRKDNQGLRRMISWQKDWMSSVPLSSRRRTFWTKQRIDTGYEHSEQAVDVGFHIPTFKKES